MGRSYSILLIIVINFCVFFVLFGRKRSKFVAVEHAIFRAILCFSHIEACQIILYNTSGKKLVCCACCHDVVVVRLRSRATVLLGCSNSARSSALYMRRRSVLRTSLLFSVHGSLQRDFPHRLGNTASVVRVRALEPNAHVRMDIVHILHNQRQHVRHEHVRAMVPQCLQK